MAKRKRSTTLPDHPSKSYKLSKSDSPHNTSSRRKSRHDKSDDGLDPEACHILRLPAELLHSILSHLQTNDLHNARLACGVFAAIGLEYMSRTIIAVFKRDRLKRLQDIASDSFADRTKTLHFQADRFRKKTLSYEKWNQERKEMRPRDEYSPFEELPIDETINFRTERGKRIIKRSYERYVHNVKGNYSKPELDRAYASYCAIKQDQQRIAEQHFDRTCLKRFFRSCVNLDEVVLAISDGTKHLDAQKTAYKEAMVYPDGDHDHLRQGCYQFWSLLEAMHQARFQPKRFTAAGISYLIVREKWQGFKTEPVMRHLMSGLHEFRFSLPFEHTQMLEYLPPWLADMGIGHMKETFSTGIFKKWLSWAPELRVLKLHMVDDGRSRPIISTADVFSHDQHWPKLRELGLTLFVTSEDCLVSLLLRHSTTLRRISLSYLDLSSGTWSSVFSRLRGQLPRLHKLKIKGSFYEQGRFCCDLGDPAGDVLAKQTPVKAAFIRHILGRDVWFPDEQEIADAYREYGIPTMDDLRPGEECDHDPGYTSDGSVVSYGSDLFDSAI